MQKQQKKDLQPRWKSRSLPDDDEEAGSAGFGYPAQDVVGGKRGMSGEMDLFWSRGDCEEVRVERIKRAMKNEGLSRDECARTKGASASKCKCKCRQVQGAGGWVGGQESGKAGEAWKEGGSKWTGRQGRARKREHGGAWRIVHSKRKERGPQGATDRCHARNVFRC